ncbi:MAG: class I adenylate-forming enzyme family protein [Lautropia sp.]
MSSGLPTVRWGKTIIAGTVAGHPCKVYADRPRAMAELLVDAQRWADRPYVVQGDRRLTGTQFAVAVARVATALRRRGVRSGQHVMLTGFNQIEWLVAFWALQCIGSMVALGNAWWSREEAGHAAELVRPELVVQDARLGHPVPAGAELLAFGMLRQVAEADGPAGLELDPVDEEAPAVVIFSSGTTGSARGVVMSHRSVIANVQNLMHMTGRLPSDLDPAHPGTVSLVTMPLFHLGGFQISMMTLLSGGTVVLPRGKFDPEEVLQLMQSERVRSWGSVPTMVSRVLRHPRFAEFDTSSVSSIQMGGAPVPPDLKAEVARCFPSSRKRVGSMYGHTEAGGVLATGAGPEIEGRPGCVGRPLPTVEIRIAQADAEGVGEILARSPTATSGYLGDPTPIADAAGWVASGDLGRLDAEGRLYVVGRSKDMIIRGGENIASVHVESCLRTHPAVAEVAVVGLPHPDLGEEVAAAVVLKPGCDVTAAALRAHAEARLARFEVPSRWWLTASALPVNATGKIVKREVLARWPQIEEVRV